MDNEEIMAEEISSSILKSGITLPPAPDNVTGLLDFAQKPVDQIDVNSFVRLVETDPGLVTKVLQFANSPFYGAINNITGLRQAIIQIGLEESVNLINLFFFRKVLPKIPPMEGFSSKGYWDHSWACGVANRMLGHPRFQVKELPGELYIAGLLHGIGKLILAIYRPEAFLECIRDVRLYEEPLAKIEMNVFGTTDSHLASKFMETWNLPANICAAVRGCQSPGVVNPEYREIAALTQFAYTLANISGIGNSGDKFCNDLSQTWISTQWSTPLADKAKQPAIAQEIISTMQQKVAGAGRKLPKEHVSQEKPQKPPAAGTPHSAPKSVKKKEGFISWIHSLFGE